MKGKAVEWQWLVGKNKQTYKSNWKTTIDSNEAEQRQGQYRYVGSWSECITRSLIRACAMNTNAMHDIWDKF